MAQTRWYRVEYDELPAETVAENAVRWIDTSIMVVDCLTKKMSPEVVHRVQSLCELNLEATPESKTLKMRKQKQRAAKTKANDDARNANSVEMSNTWNVCIAQCSNKDDREPMDLHTFK